MYSGRIQEMCPGAHTGNVSRGVYRKCVQGRIQEMCPRAYTGNVFRGVYRKCVHGGRDFPFQGIFDLQNSVQDFKNFHITDQIKL